MRALNGLFVLLLLGELGVHQVRRRLRKRASTLDTAVADDSNAVPPVQAAEAEARAAEAKAARERAEAERQVRRLRASYKN